MISLVARRALLLIAGMAGPVTSASAQPADGPVKIMDSYAAALAANDVEALVGLYTPNGVFIRDEMTPVVGREALRAAYKQVFATLKVNLAFTIHEVEVVGDIAWLRGTSAGKVKVLATGKEYNDAYNQVVVFRREAGAWKIRSYIYASSKSDSAQPPR